MKKLYLVLLFIQITSTFFAQINPPNEEKPNSDNLKKNEIEATYNGSFLQFLISNLKYPKKAIKNNVQGVVTISFIIDTFGKVSYVKLSENSVQKNEDLVKEAIRIIKLSSGKWNPGIISGKKVKTFHEQSINFILSK